MSKQPQRLPLTAWVVAFLVAVVLITAAARIFKASERRDIEETAPLGNVPEFRFTTQEEKTLTRADLLGKVWVVDFFFTRCPGPCPVMTSRMA